MKRWNISGIALRLLGYALMTVASLVGGSLLFALFDELNRQSGNLGTWLMIALVFALATLVWRAGHKYYKMGIKHSSPSAEESVAKAPRPPVIYLRSFLDDSLASHEEPSYEMAGGVLVENWFSQPKSSNWPRL